MVGVCSAHPRVLVIEPTSLMRGEGLVSGLSGLVRRVSRGCRGVEDGWWWWRNEPISTVMQLMSV